MNTKPVVKNSGGEEYKRVQEREIMRNHYNYLKVNQVTRPIAGLALLVLEIWWSYPRDNEYISVLADDFHVYMPTVTKKSAGYRVQFCYGGIKMETFVEFTCRLPMTMKRVAKVSQKVHDNKVW